MDNSNKNNHLQMIQDIITRMAQNSFFIKECAVGVMVAIYALVKDESSKVVIISIIPTIVFWALDAYYLMLERMYRCLYDAVRVKDEKDIAVAEPTRLSDELSKASERLSKELSETAKKILMLIIADNDVSRKELAEKTGISTNAVQKHLNKLKALGFIRRTGSARYGYWEVKEHKL